MTPARLSFPTQEHNESAWPPETWLILFVGAMFYGPLCWPAIEHGGRSRLDPVWSAMPWLWLVPLLIYEIVDTRPLRAKVWLVLGYAFVTAFFFSGTLGSSIPRSVSLRAMALAALVLVGPFHVCVAFTALLLVRLVRRMLRAVFARMRVLVWGGKFAAVSVVLGGAIVFLVVARERAFAIATQSAIDAADESWRKGHVFHFKVGNETLLEYHGKTIERFVDPETGLAIVSRGFWSPWGLVDYAGIHNDRVRELIAERGVPDWSLKAHLVADEDLVAMLDSSEFTEIKTFPHRVTTYVSVREREGTFEIESRRPGVLDLTNANDGEYRFGRFVGAIFIGRHPKYPQVVFLRRGKEWIGAYHESGVLLAVAYQPNPPLEVGRPCNAE